MDSCAWSVCLVFLCYLHYELIACRVRQKAIANGLIQSWCEPCCGYPKQIDYWRNRFVALLLCSSHNSYLFLCFFFQTKRFTASWNILFWIDLIPFFTKSWSVGKRRRTALEIERSNRVIINKALRTNSRLMALERSSEPGKYIWIVSINLYKKKDQSDDFNVFAIMWIMIGYLSGQGIVMYLNYKWEWISQSRLWNVWLIILTVSTIVRLQLWRRNQVKRVTKSILCNFRKIFANFEMFYKKRIQFEYYLERCN